MAAPVLTIDSVDVTDEIHGMSITVGRNTLDVILYDPAALPVLGDAVALTNPTWAGTVTSFTVEDRDIESHTWVKVIATNEDELTLTAGGSLSDATNDYRKLSITRTIKDTVEEIRGSLETFIDGHLPGHTFTLTSATHGLTAEEMTIREVNVSWLRDDTPLYKITFGDEMVTLSAWAQSPDAGILPITETKITDGAVSTPKIAAGAITSETLAAQLVLASLIKTAESGQRIEMDPDGLRSYSADEDLLVNIPTNDPDSVVYVNGQIEATDLVVTGDEVLQGTGNALASGSITTLESFQAPPTQAPSLAQGYEAGPSLATPSPWPGYRGHGYYDPNGGADGSTPCFVQAGVTVSGSEYTITVNEWDWATGLLDRSTQLPGPLTSSTTMVPSITRIGTHWYIVTRQGINLKLRKYLRSDGSAVATNHSAELDFFAYDPFATPIATDGTDIFVPGGSSANNLRIVRYNTSLSKQATIELTEPSFTGNSLGWPAQYVIANLGSANRHYIGLQHTNAGVETAHNVYEFGLTTGAPVATNTEFPYVSLGGAGNSSKYALVYDGSNFWGQNTTNGPFSKFTNWIWTTASAKYWVAYSWYDSVGTTHETTVGPRASITMKKRSQLTVTTQALPGSGGADEPDNRRIYMFPNATSPATTSLDLQATSTAASVTLTTYNSGGAAPPTSNGFSSIAVPALLRSANDEWVLKGNGEMQFGGDTTIARNAANSLRINNTLSLGTATGSSYAAGIRFGTDIDLGKSAADVLQLASGDRFEGFLRFVPINRVTIFNTTTASTIARTLSGAISGVPDDAIAVSLYGDIASDGTVNNSNFIQVYQTQSGTNDSGIFARATAGVSLFTGFNGIVGCVQSSGAKVSYTINRATGTISYNLFCTGYWTDKA